MLRNSAMRHKACARNCLLNEVLSLNAQESMAAQVLEANFGVLNEVLSLNAQE